MNLDQVVPEGFSTTFLWPSRNSSQQFGNCVCALSVISSRIFLMVDTKRQVPQPSTQAWSVDLNDVGGLAFTVMRTSAEQAREAVVNHLVEIGAGLTRMAAESLVGRATVTEVSVIW